MRRNDDAALRQAGLDIYTASNVDRWGGCYAEPYFPTPCANVCLELVIS